MDAWLAQAYGTNGGAAEDLEKIAQAEMAQQLAQQEGIDLSGLTEEQVAQLGNEMLQQGQGQQQGGQPGAPQMPQQGMQPQQSQQQMQGQQPGGEGGIDPSQLTEGHVQEAQQVLANPQSFPPEVVQEAQAIMQIVEQFQAQQAGQQPTQEMAKVAEANAKFEESDFLGRVMAHAFNQEMEKIAAAKQANMMHAAGHHLKHLGQAAKHHAGRAAHAVGHHMAHHPGHAAAAGAVGGAAAMHGAHHMMKEATINAIEKAAMQQAANILQANGIDPTTGQPLQQQPAAPSIAPAGGVAPQQTQGAQAALGDLVEKRAHQILRSRGYNI